MSILTYTVRVDYPRLHCISGDKTAITTRTNATGSWKTVWDGTYKTGVDNLLGDTDLSLCDSEGCIEDFFALGLYGWIENTASYHTKLLSAAKYLASHDSLWPSWTSINARMYACAMAYAYEFLRTGVITFSAADRAIVGGMCADYAGDKGWPSTNDWFHGHSPGDYMGVLACGLVLAGEYGSGYDFRTEATHLIDEALDMWYGADATAPSRLEVVRYFYADGGSLEGGNYTRLSNYECLFMLNFVSNAFIRNTETPNSLQLNGSDYAPWTDEEWVQKLPEYLLWWERRGDGDCFGIHDTNRSYPWFHGDARRMLEILITRGGNWRKQIRWMRDILNTENIAGGEGSWSNYSHSVVFWDPADTDNASLSPAATTPAIAKTRFFDPPGSFWHTNSWDKPNSCIINVECPKWFAYYGHMHLLAGAMQISVKNDMVLCCTGCYRSGDDPSDYGGSHFRTWYQQSISHSGVPLIHKSGLTHTNRNAAGTRVSYPSGLGGQLWRRRYDGSNWDYEPDDLDALLTDDSALGWRITTPTQVANTDDYAFWHCDLRRAYLYEPTDYGTSAERVTVCETKDLIIKGESVWPIVLRLTRINATSTSYVKRQHFHSYNQWTSTYPHGDGGDTRRFAATGSKGTGKVVIDLYNWPDFTAQQVGGGSTVTGGFSQYQFYFDGVNYPPTTALNARWPPDIGRYRLDLIAAIARNDEYYATLIMPMGVNDTPQEYEWVDIDNWYGVKFATTGHEYRVHKTLAQAEYLSAGEEADTTPPAAPVGLAAVAGDTKVVLTWTPNTESDMASYDVYYRVKV